MYNLKPLEDIGSNSQGESSEITQRLQIKMVRLINLIAVKISYPRVRPLKNEETNDTPGKDICKVYPTIISIQSIERTLTFQFEKQLSRKQAKAMKMSFTASKIEVKKNK